MWVGGEVRFCELWKEKLTDFLFKWIVRIDCCKKENKTNCDMRAKAHHGEWNIAEYFCDELNTEMRTKHFFFQVDRIRENIRAFSWSCIRCYRWWWLWREPPADELTARSGMRSYSILIQIEHWRKPSKRYENPSFEEYANSVTNKSLSREKTGKTTVNDVQSWTRL